MPGGRRGPVSKTLRELAAMRMRIGRERRVSLDEATQITGTLSRRRFLQAGGVAGAGLLLGGCTSSGPRSTPPSALPTEDAATEPRIAIVGAGLAGLAAAYWLTRTGVRVRVYEARPRVGGRCWSARGFDGGQVAEHGGEFVDTRHVHIARLAEELGLELDDLWSTWIIGFALADLCGRSDRSIGRSIRATRRGSERDRQDRRTQWPVVGRRGECRRTNPRRDVDGGLVRCECPRRDRFDPRTSFLPRAGGLVRARSRPSLGYEPHRLLRRGLSGRRRALHGAWRERSRSQT